MTEPKDHAQEQAAARAEEEAAFGASYDGAEMPTIEAPVAEVVEPVAEPVVEAVKEAAPVAPIPAAAPAFDSEAEIRKVNGRLGAMNSLLQDVLKAKEVAGKPAELTPVELSRMKAAYPELAVELEADMAAMLAKFAPKAADPKDTEALIEQRVQTAVGRIEADMRTAAVTDRHETWKQDLWVGGELGKERTPDYTAWLKSMPEADAKTFEASANPYYVAKTLDQFYSWKAKATKTQTEKTDRLKAAITPKGVPATGQSTMSDDEAAQKGFLEGFNS